MITRKFHTVVLGSGAAGLAAALRLRAEGIENVAIVTEGLDKGTSINTGSDKQTYYKLGICGKDLDSPVSLAESLRGSSAHGDIALVEAVTSVRAFSNLVNIGVPFPRDAYGQFAGYKTDHDPLRRATSCGPYTSREMCRALIKEVQVRQIPVFERRVAVKLVMVDGRAAGLIAVDIDADQDKMFEYYMADNVVFAVGGPGGLYDCSVYPAVHTGAIGLALQLGAEAAGLPESQFGLASIKFRWNVSGTYMQVLPRFISTDADGNDAREFLRPYFPDAGTMNSMVFLKGYQWPFDTRKIPDGSSIVDILVYEETAIRGRRVWLDFRTNPEGFDFAALSEEARTYLEKSGAAFGTPLERLLHMNPGAVELYKEHDIDLEKEPLEIAVCSQHNNGGLSGNIWYESTNIKHLFPIGEVNGSHGVTRPGGSALNAGQVGAFRSAEYIANVYTTPTLDEVKAAAEAEKLVSALADQAKRPAERTFREERQEFQHRMSTFGAHIRDPKKIAVAAKDAWAQYRRMEKSGVGAKSTREVAEALRNLQLCYAHAVYLDAIEFQLSSGVGSRGSAMAADPDGIAIHPMLGNEWRFKPEDESFRSKQLITVAEKGSKWIDCRPIPESDDWFENVWADFRNKKIYR
ncbi:MAG: FAD-binding protein [Victivallaceae bacterium]|nr:FAD-binding protein [Victivallaceae bacterium]